MHHLETPANLAGLRVEGVYRLSPGLRPAKKSGAAEPVGTNTRPMLVSAEIGAHALPAPVFAAASFDQC